MTKQVGSFNWLLEPGKEYNSLLPAQDFTRVFVRIENTGNNPAAIGFDQGAKESGYPLSPGQAPIVLRAAECPPGFVSGYSLLGTTISILTVWDRP